MAQQGDRSVAVWLTQADTIAHFGGVEDRSAVDDDVADLIPALSAGEPFSTVPMMAPKCLRKAIYHSPIKAVTPCLGATAIFHEKPE